MNLSEIETILEELVKRHPDLDTVLLGTLLHAAGWEDRLTKDALLLFKQKYPEKDSSKKETVKSVATPSQEDIAFLNHEGKEEGSLPVIVTVPAQPRPQQQASFFGALFEMFFGSTTSSPVQTIPQRTEEPPKPAVIIVEEPVKRQPSVHVQPVPPVVLPALKPHEVVQPEPVSHVVLTPVQKTVQKEVSITPPFRAVEEQKKDPLITQTPQDSVNVDTIIQEKQIHVQQVTPSQQQVSFLGALFEMFFGSTKTDSSHTVSLPKEPKVPVAPTVKPEAKISQPVFVNTEINTEKQAPHQPVEEHTQDKPLPLVQANYKTSSPPLPLVQHEGPPVVDILRPDDARDYTRVSLVPHTEQQSFSKKETGLPENLPVVPFESSPHVWSFARYKDVFHGEPGTQQATVKLVTGEESHKIAPSSVIPKEAEEVVTKKPEETNEEEVVIQKTPLTKSDESLVFLAGVMLLLIILILGYMYGNGRL